jgi:hypothetical protein
VDVKIQQTKILYEMKTLLIVVFLFGISTLPYCAEMPAAADSVVIDKLDNLIKVHSDGAAALNKLIAKTDVAKTTTPGFLQWTFVLLPVFLFVALLFYFLKWLKRDGYKMADALSVDMSDEQVEELQRAARQPIAAGTETPPAPQPVLKRSSSRFIAFLSGLSAVIMGLCIVSYYMYFAILGLPIPKFEELWPILGALGIGVVPYATKVMSEKK